MPEPCHLEHDFRGVLQVGVHHDHGVAFGQVHAGGDGNLVAEVAGEVHHLEPRVEPVDPLHHHVAAVPAAVIHEQHLRLTVEPIQKAGQTAVKVGKRRLLVVHGDDDGVPRMAHGLLLPLLLVRCHPVEPE